MTFEGIIFDLDGTLIDNNHHWHVANEKFFSALKIPHASDDREYFSMVNGRSMPESVQILKDRFKLPHSVEELYALKTKFTDDIYSFLAMPMPGAEELLTALQALPVKTAIASGSPLGRIKQIVDRFGWADYFDELVSVDHVNYVGKPDPAVFSYAARSLATKPAQCVVIEDAVNGVMAAKAAGMTCVLVDTDEYEGCPVKPDHTVLSLADTRLYSILGL